MTPDSAMVLTGKQSSRLLRWCVGRGQLRYRWLRPASWAPNGQGAVLGPPTSLRRARSCSVTTHHSYLAPGERFPRRAATTDPVDRDVRSFPHTHPSSDFETVGDIFSSAKNPDRKKPFDIRTVMRSVVDQDHSVSRALGRHGRAPTPRSFWTRISPDIRSQWWASNPARSHVRGTSPPTGPDTWTSGTLFPNSSKKTARAINAASGKPSDRGAGPTCPASTVPRRSLRNIQLEYGAEIGRAIVNFDGPIVFCVVSRYHGGAFVVFSGALNDNMEVLAVEGSFASVLGGAPRRRSGLHP